MKIVVNSFMHSDTVIYFVSLHLSEMGDGRGIVCLTNAPLLLFIANAFINISASRVYTGDTILCMRNSLQ